MFTKRNWTCCCQSYREMFQKIATFPSTGLQDTLKVFDCRGKMEKLIEQLDRSFQEAVSYQNQYSELARVLRNHERDINDNKDFVEWITVEKPEEETLPPGEHTTYCTNCHHTCHYSCAYRDDEDKKNCCAIGSNGYCTVCEGHCHWSVHRNYPYRYRLVPRKEQVTKEKMRQKYGDAQSGKLKVDSSMKQLEREYSDAWKRAYDLLRSYRLALDDLNKVAMVVEKRSERDYIKLLLENEQKAKSSQAKEKFLKDALKLCELMEEVSQVKTDADIEKFARSKFRELTK